MCERVADPRISRHTNPMFALLPLLAEVIATPALPSRGDVRTIFSADDYPAAAMKLNQEGDSQARLTVGADGRPTQCTLVVSSGSPSLDSATCEILLARARFTPARDSSGHAVTDYYTTPKIAWRLGGPQLLSAGSLFSSDDYPDSAIYLGQEGDVQSRLTVDANGAVSDCVIIQSSGFPALDAATCDTFRKRARFTPELDASGRPMTQQIDAPKVGWRIEGNELPIASWTIRLLVSLDKKGAPQLCSILAGGALGKRSEPTTMDCSYLSGAFTVPSELASRFAGKKAVLIFDQQFVPRTVNSIDTPRDLKKYALVSRDVIRFSIDTQGRVGGCRRARTEGSYTPPTDGCDVMRSRRFKPDPKLPGGLIAATATTAIYAYGK